MSWCYMGIYSVKEFNNCVFLFTVIKLIFSRTVNAKIEKVKNTPEEQIITN